jgi:hypothetical protein
MSESEQLDDILIGMMEKDILARVYGKDKVG